MKDLTKGSIPSHILHMAIPIAIGMVVQTIYYLIDLYFVGQLGKTALAGVNAAGNLTFLVIGLTQILGVGTVAVISQAVGKKERDVANQFFNQSIGLAALLGLLTLIGGYLLADEYLRSVVSDEPTINEGLSYLYWFIPNLALQFALVAMSSALRGTGIVKPTMIVQMISIVINIILSPLLITGFLTGYPMGVAGAGLASSIAIFIAILMMWHYFNKLERYVGVKRSQLVPSWAHWKKIIAIGFPAGGEFVLLFFYMAIIYWAIQGFGPSAQAGFGLGSKVMQAVFVPALALAFALPAVVGQNFGATEFNRVRQAYKTTLIMIGSLMGALTVFTVLAAEFIVAPFSQDPSVLIVSVTFLQLIALNYIPSGVVFTCSGMLQGLGNTWPAFYSMASRLIFFVLPVIWFSHQPDFKIVQVWYLSVGTVLLQSVISLFLVNREMKKKLV